MNNETNGRVFVSYRHRTAFIVLSALLAAAASFAVIFAYKTSQLSESLAVLNQSKIPDTRYDELSRLDVSKATYTDGQGFSFFVVYPTVGGRWEGPSQVYIKEVPSGSGWHLVKLREHSFKKNSSGYFKEETNEFTTLEVCTESYLWFVNTSTPPVPVVTVQTTNQNK